MKRTYITKRFQKQSVILIHQANEIIEEYKAAGFNLTLRQLYYQFVSRGYIPNKQSEYNKLGNVINDARLAGLVDWDVIIDRTRSVKMNSHWNNPAEILESAMYSYAVDKRKDQEFYIEVWIEKDALTGVIHKVCSNNDVPYFSCRGYTSLSEIWAAAQRIIRAGKQTIILHLGDHDPSGIDMTRDIEERLNIFCFHQNINIQIERVALNYDQVEEYNPPPNPAKATDTRFNGYYEDFGSESWELDALNPKVIEELIQTRLNIYTDYDAYTKRQKLEDAHKRLLKKLIENVQQED